MEMAFSQTLERWQSCGPYDTHWTQTGKRLSLFRFVRCSPFRSQPFSVFTAFSFTFPFRASILENAGTRRRAQKTALAQTKSYTTAKSKMRPAARPSKQAIFSRETTRSLLSRRQESIGERKKTHTNTALKNNRENASVLEWGALSWDND